MSKELMISIHPEHAIKILNGEKTVEIRKTIPKCELPAEVYIYVTKSTYGYMIGHMMFSNNDLTFDPDVKKYKFGDSCYLMCVKNDYSEDNFLNGKIVAKFTLNKAEDMGRMYSYRHKDFHFYDLLNASCLTIGELDNYTYIPIEKRKNDYPNLYAWHIEQLEIFDKPKELKDFGLKHAPQKYAWVERK